MAARKPAAKTPARPKVARAKKSAARKTPARKPSTTTPAARKPAGAKKAARRKAPARARKGPAVKALERELKSVLKPVADSTLAASALALACQLDKPRISATATASCSRALMDTLERLRALAPPPEEEDALDGLKARRHARRGGAGT